MMKINNFRGDLTDISAKKEALQVACQLVLQQTYRYIHFLYYQ